MINENGMNDLKRDFYSYIIVSLCDTVLNIILLDTQLFYVSSDIFNATYVCLKRHKTTKCPIMKESLNLPVLLI